MKARLSDYYFKNNLNLNIQFIYLFILKILNEMGKLTKYSINSLKYNGM